MLTITEATTRERSYDEAGRREVVAYVWPKGETLMENLAERYARPYEAWRPLVEAKLKELGIGYEKLAWRQRAGCTCPCSPGFVLRGNTRRISVSMTLEDVAA